MVGILSSILLCLLGVAFGIVVAGGLFAFMTTIGVVTRLTAATKTAKHTMCYESVILFGAMLSNFADLFRLGILWKCATLRIVYGVFSGIFTGCLAAALAEVIQVMPVFASRIRLKKGMPFIVAAFALGKMFGSWIMMVVR